MRDDKHSDSCLCEQTDFEIIAMEPTGEAQVEDTWDSNLWACCAYPTEHCGWSSSITMSNSQSVTWSDTTEVGFSLEVGAEVPADLALTKIGFQMKNSFTTGQTHSTSVSQTYSSGCLCDADHCKGPFTKLDYKLKEVKSTQSVKITAKKCGMTRTLDGSVQTSQFMANYECLINNVNSCPKMETLGEAAVMV